MQEHHDANIIQRHDGRAGAHDAIRALTKNCAAELAILEFIGSELKKKEKKARKAAPEETTEEKEATAKS